MFTSREFQIANRLLATSAAMRIKDLAEIFKVSPRAIQYDLEAVKQFLKGQSIAFCSSSGRGIWLECTDEQRAAAVEALSQIEGDSLYLDQAMRTQRIYLWLIFSEGYLTAGALAESLNVSRNTILSDMDQMHTVLQDSGLILRRQARRGYRLEGKEIALRMLGENLIQKSISVYDIYQIISHLKSGTRHAPLPQLLSDLAGPDYPIIEREMIAAFQAHGAELERENIILMLVRLLISIARMRMGQFVGSATEPAKEGTHYLLPWWSTIFRQSQLPLLQDEVDYILGRYQEETLPVDAAAFSADLVSSISYLENFPYSEDKTLYPRLIAHIRHNFSSEKQSASVNPFHTLILENHARLFANIRTVCRRHIDSTYLFSNDSFVSYLALHFIVSQRNLGVGRRMRVVYVCATGRGAAQILERILETQIRRLEVVQHASLSEVHDVVTATRPDFVISVFPIESTVPVVVVEPLPTKANLDAIQQLIDSLTDEDELLYHNQAINLRVGSDKEEELSQEAILIGLKLYASFLEDETCVVKPGMEFAFLAHVMLLANRYVFDKQFRHKAGTPAALDLLIRSRLEEIGVYLTLDEIKALVYYFSEVP